MLVLHYVIVRGTVRSVFCAIGCSTNYVLLMARKGQTAPNMSKIRRMNVFKKTVSDDAMAAEWEEVQAAQRNPARFQPLYERYYDPIFRFVFRRVGSEQLTADLCSQVFLKAMQRLSKYEYRGVPFSAWLYRIASNEVTQHFRQHQKNRVVSVEEGQVADLADEMEDVDSDLLLDQLSGVLDELKETDLQLIELRFFEQRPFKEIADILGITESNAKVKTYRILEKLKRKLIRQSESQ